MKIVFNETSFEVVLLHKALRALGFVVASEEIAQRRAGEDTRSKVRALQAQLGTPADDATLVDETTASAIEDALKQRGLATGSRAFTVNGTVRRRDGSPRRRQQLLAFDLDLRGVTSYRSVRSVEEIARSGGYDFLGYGASDSQGRYSVTFYDWQYRRAERKKADVVVFAIETSKGETRILGGSRLVRSEDYSDTGTVEKLDIFVGEPEGGIEYQRVMGAVTPFLEESNVALAYIVDSSEQVAFTASELDLELEQVAVAAAAARLTSPERERSLSHELLYGLGRQGIALDWTVIARAQAGDLTLAISKSMTGKIIHTFDAKEVAAFVAALLRRAVEHVLEQRPTDANNVNTMLSNALPNAVQRASFLSAVHTFKGTDARTFWTEHLRSQPEFKNDPKLISSVLFNQQLTLLTGNHQALVKELQLTRGLDSAQRLLDLDRGQWIAAIKKAGIPDFIEGQDDDARAQAYAEGIEGVLNATFPTQRIARMVAGQRLPIETAATISAFLTKTPNFDFATSRVHDFGKEIRATAGDQAERVTSDLMKLQRVYQVSTRPESMAALLRNDLHSAYSIANVPRKSFMKTYSSELGGEWEAYAVHQRASHVAAKTELAAAHLYEYTNGNLPASIMGRTDLGNVLAAIENQVPNYARLFGSPDICECEHCRSVYSPAAYFVDLLRFLRRSEPNQDGDTPLDELTVRRPDLVNLPLSCENTNTVIPYIDLANEIMEYYVAHNSLTNFKGYDTGETTAEELRANPQNFDLEAYRKLKDAKHPFTLPYHQPLDVIRTYSDHLKVSRHEVMRAMSPTPGTALAAEALRLSQEEYRVLTGEAFDGAPDATPLHAYFGYTAAGQLEGMSAVREFLRRAGVEYTALVELIKTKFINPHQGTLEFIEKVFASSTIEPSALYTKLGQIAAGTLDPAADAAITAALAPFGIAPADFGAWVVAHFAELQQVVTLYEPTSRCDLDTTRLRSLQSIYEGMATSGIANSTWSKVHRFIRLWRKLGWTIHETDLMLTALGQSDITSTTIDALASVWRLRSATKLAVNLTAALWGDIDSYGDKSLYRKLFLNKAVQQIDDAFTADPWGSYLEDTTALIADHASAILAAFRMREEDLAAIFGVSGIAGTDVLNLANLSAVYRHVVLAKALKLRVADLCKLIELWSASPFVDPEQTFAFYELAGATKAAGFKPTVLEYIFAGTLPAESTIGLDRAKTLGVAKDVRDTFSAIEQDHPDAPPSPLAREVVAAKLALTFKPEVVATFLGILDGTITFEALADANLTVVIPDPLAAKYTYVKGSGRLICAGVMTDDERTDLKGLANINGTFEDAVDKLYAAPQTFLRANFDRVFTNQADAYATLLDHPHQVTAATLEEKLVYSYEHFVPILKSKLRRDAITQHIATVIKLSEEATALLIAQDVEGLVTTLSTRGLSASYFNDTTWTTAVDQATDESVDFEWGLAAPRATVNADNFSVRWRAYLAPPASGEYTFVVSVAEADEAFRLHLDDTLILEKAAGDPSTSFEVVTTLNAARMYGLTLEYAETAQNAGVLLEWKTATTALEVVPPTSTYPAAILDAFVALATVYHRAAKFIAGFALSETELDHFLSFAGDFGGIDFKALTPGDWQRIRDYTVLRNAVPQAQALLTDVFAAANTPNPAPTVAGLKTKLHEATAWDRASIDFLVDTHFTLGVSAFKNEIALDHLREVMRIVANTGLAAETIAVWGAVATDFDALHATAQLMKNTVKSKYGESDWLELAGGLSDTLRGHQQQALVAYLLTRPAIHAWGAEDADGLFEYFLIDVQMDPCMDTSRIVQANSSIQMFVNRCLLNLESDLSSGDEQGVSPGAIDKDRWEWMKAYRVWEANRKVFLYPENWLEPEWRNDRSELFKDLESYLVQNDITDRSVEQGFRNYLGGLNEVANIEVCGIHREDHDDGKLRYLHVFGRTQHAPFKYFYRRWNEYQKWSAWERVSVDIRGVDASKENGDGGVHLVPVVWKKRLFLFWPEFTVKRDNPAKGSRTVKNAADESLASFEPTPHWEIKLGFTEYVDGKWTPKQVTKEFVLEGHYWHIPGERTLRYATDIDSENRLIIYCIAEYSDPRNWIIEGAFELTDIASRIVADQAPFFVVFEDWDQRYVSHFQNVATKSASKLELNGNTYLKKATQHLLLPASAMRNFDLALDEPFFFRDARRNYFVRPIAVTIVDRVKNPGLYYPYLPIEVYYEKAKPIPEIGPDDYLPQPGEVFAGRPGEVFAGRPAAGRPGVAAGGPAVAGRTPAMTRSAAPGMLRALSATGTTGNMALMDLDLGVSNVGRAFAGDYTMGSRIGSFLTSIRIETGLEFHTFYHPFASQYVKRLNEGELPRLMASDTSIASDNGSTFESAYEPDSRFVPRKSDFATRTYYKENVCFDVYGANSSYNWELFFHAPLYIATRLSKNGKYEEAMRWFHHIFDPTTDEMPAAGQSEVSRYWKVLPFKTTPATSLEDWFRTLGPNGNPNTENAVVAEWRDHPFDPHLVASNRPLAYMKHVVIKYVENLIAWGDALFRQDTMESVNEALQIYVIANHILGPRPQFVPKRGEISIETYASLENKWDDFSNALVELENVFPYSGDAGTSTSSPGTSLLGIGSALYFCIPANDKLLGQWDTVADRLYKIRHCQNIDGVERHLALFAPPIDPAALIQATSQGLSLGSILADLSSPPPIYRFTFLLQKANELCADLRSLGSSLLAALEKKDAEELARLRQSQEIHMLELTTAIRERQVLVTRSNKENLAKSRETAELRLAHYTALLGSEVAPPAQPSIGATLTADSQLPADTALAKIETDVDVTLADTDEAGVKIITKEKEELDQLDAARGWQIAAQAAESLAAIAHVIPSVTVDGKPFGVGAGVIWGGTQLGNALNAAGKILTFVSSFATHSAATAAKMAGYIRREQEWTLQANLAARDVIALDKQLVSADIQIQVAEKELENHKQSIENSKQVEQFLRAKFSNQELYQWMREQLFAVYKQSYNLCYEMAKKAEKAFKHEIGTETASFIQYGYWDNSKQGLVAGDKLQLALRQMERAYLDDNRRELELTKNVSIARLDPLALIELRGTGRCRVSLPEELFDLDFRGHYFRRIKAVRLSIPCVVGPHTSIACTLRLTSNSIRVNTSMNQGGTYEHENDAGEPIDDDRFRTSLAPVTAIAASQGQNDSGMFEFNFRDERYLPFERAGAISDWQIELSTEKDLRQFDYATITDVILHLSYSAREAGGLFKSEASKYLRDKFLVNADDLGEQPLVQMFSLKHELPTEWYRFLHPAAMGGEQVLSFALGKERFPFFVQDRDLVIERIELLATCRQAMSYHAIVSYTNRDGDPVTSAQITVPQNATYGGLNKTTIEVNGAGLDLEELDVAAPMTLKLKAGNVANYASLATNPDEVEDAFLVMSYKLS
jgi:hypothetical protein